MQGVRQVYVLVLGLDVIGNPYGLIHGIGEGVRDFFYEPYQVKLVSHPFFVLISDFGD